MGDCHYQTGNVLAERRMKILEELMEFYGIERERLRVKWVSSAEAQDLVETLSDFSKTLEKLGPLGKLQGDGDGEKSFS